MKQTISEFEVDINENNYENNIETIDKNIVIKKTESKLESLFEEIHESIFNFKKSFSTFQSQIKKLEKEVKKEKKNLNKEINKIKLKKRVKKPSGFAKAVPISKELCDFMDKPNGSQIARTEVTRFIINYIKSNDLQSTLDKQCIIPDIKLQKLLDNDSGEVLTYFNIQKFMNKHFLK